MGPKLILEKVWENNKKIPGAGKLYQLPVLIYDMKEVEILFSNLKIDVKNCLFSKRKAVEILLLAAFRQKWLGWLKAVVPTNAKLMKKYDFSSG